MLNYIIKTINWVDILVVILLIRTTYIGLSQGFAVEVFKSIGLICASVVSMHNYNRLGEFVNSYSFFSSPTASKAGSFIILTCAVLLVFKLLRIIFQFIAKIEVVSWLERFGGIIIGLCRGVLLSSVILFILTLMPPEYVKRSVDTNSLSGPYLVKITPATYDFIIKFLPLSKK